ncbi:MAG: sulfatase [Fuerstiella sp.]|nr:sulfatase [Fuerstiella sp.]
MEPPRPACLFLCLVCLSAPPAFASASGPNVLLIAVDDLNDWVGHLGGHPQARTPNIDRLAARGVSFTRAYCSAPLCNPSRISLLAGVEPSRSGVYGNGEKLRNKLPDAVTLMQYLRANDYTARGGGKIFHSRRAGDPGSWDFYFVPSPSDGQGRVRPTSNLPKSAWAPWGPLDIEDKDMFDVKVVNWAVSELNRTHEQPFFLACGFTKPHLPWYVPRKYFDLHPLDSIQLPATKDDDLDDLPASGRKLARKVYDPSGERDFATPGGDHANVIAHDQWCKAVQAYLATISFVDTHVGRLLEALEQSGHADNTIVVLWGDHGWHLGEKQHWRKHALWETTTRTPLIITAPGIAAVNKLCERPVSLIDLYPTLVELCGLPARDGLDGQSIVPLLKSPRMKWHRPALTTYGPGNHAVRTGRWRYIRYHDGGEELYDHNRDPHEWQNLATSPEHADVIRELRKLLPAEQQP